MAAAGSVGAMVPVGATHCISCKVAVPVQEQVTWTREGTTFVRCKGCHYWPRRLKAVVGKLEPEQADVFDSLSKDDKLRFMQEHKNILGDQLKKAIETYVERVHTKAEVLKFKGKGNFVDLEAAFSTKPEQLAHIKLHARTIECDTRGVTMYELPEYSVTRLTTTTDATNRGLSAGSKDVLKLKNQAKEDSIALGNLSKTNTSKLKKVEFKLAQQREELAMSLTRAALEKYATFVPPKIKDQAELALKSADIALQAAGLSQQSEWDGDIADIFAEVYKGLELATSFSAKMKLLLSYADEANGEVEEEKDEEGANAEGEQAEGENPEAKAPAAKAKAEGGASKKRRVDGKCKPTK
jgi:hypothetical protein